MKTGTAQVGGDLKPHAWVIGYTEKGPQSVIIVVFLENGGESRIAIPAFEQISKTAIEKYFSNSGQP
jgi:cell division protein FtsI/penicillin-binding protein 2